MAHDRSKRCGSIQVALAAGCWLLAGCSLVTGFDQRPDAGDNDPDIEEHDAAASTPDVEDASSDEEPTDAEDADTSDAAEDDATSGPGPDPGADSGPGPADGAAPDTDPGPGQTPDSGAPGAAADAGAARPSINDLIDAVAGERTDRTDRICACPGAGQECVRAGFGKSSCLERAIMLLSGTSQESVRALLECMLPAEQAYTKCVEQRLRCVSVEASTSTCDIEYELATTRCNVASLQGLSLQSLCSRSGGR